MFTTIAYKGTLGIDCCDHEHKTRDEAQLCLVQHQNELRKGGKVSKRQVVEIDSLDDIYGEDHQIY